MVLASTGCDDVSRHTIAGTVSGLAGTGLVLRNAGADLPIDADGVFVLSDAFAAGTAYDVTVAVQPQAPAQACTVSHGAGVVRDDVADIAVTCVTTPLTRASSDPAAGATGVATDVAPSLTFSSDVDADTVAGHVALFRGTQSLAVDAALTSDDTVTVTPQAPLCLHTTYTLVTDPGLLGVYGETVAASSTSFTTRDGSWQPAGTVKVAAPNAQDARIAMLSDGSAIAVWYQYDGPVANVWANTYTDAGGWGTATTIESNDLGDAVNPKIAVDAQGHAFVVWSQSNGTRTDIWGNRYTVGSGWGAGARISESTVGSANYSPNLAVAPSGDVVIVWINVDTQDQSVWAQVFPASGASTTPARIDVAVGNASDARVVIDARGSATVLYGNSDGSTYDLWTTRYSGGTWQAATTLENSSLSVSEFSIAIDGTGRVFAAWTQQIDGSSQGVYARPYVEGSGWGTTASIAATTNSSAYYPDVVTDAEGRAMLLWGQYDASVLHEYASVLSEQSGWGAPVLTPMGIGARVGFDANGNALAVWNAEASFTSRVIRSSRYHAATGWSAPVTLTPGANAYAEYPQLAIDACGAALAVWFEYDSANNRTDILGGRFGELP